METFHKDITEKESIRYYKLVGMNYQRVSKDRVNGALAKDEAKVVPYIPFRKPHSKMTDRQLKAVMDRCEEQTAKKAREELVKRAEGRA